MSDTNPSNSSGALLTISSDGKKPETRMASANDTQSFVQRLRENDIERSKKRAAVRGLVDGNPPYKASSLRAAGRAEACNVNWGTARAYLESAIGAFYDLTSEAPGIVAVQTSYGKTDEERDTFSRILSAEADKTFHAPDLDWDFDDQQSLNEGILHGRGPYLFENADKPFPRAVHDGDVKVPERTSATLSRFEVCAVDVDYLPPELYEFIRDEEAAKAIGWDVEYTQKVIANAMDIQQPSSRAWDWEFYQDQLKQNSLNFVDESKICPLSHVFWKEFSGKITHAIVQRDGMANAEPKYLFFHHERYNRFEECVQPMYYDRGNGGWHYSVTGLGTKMFGAMVYENRLLCNLMDKAFAPKIFFKFGNAGSETKFQLSTFGDWGRVPVGTDFIQNPIQGMLNDGLAMYRTSSELMRSNLSSYRQQVPTEGPGNPPTKFQKQLEAAQQSALSKTAINRHYTQRDVLYAEIVRRLCNINTTDERARGFQKRVLSQGVPRECFGRIESVHAVRVVGEGNAFLRKQTLGELQANGVVAQLPEEGRDRWLNDMIAATCGNGSVTRYNPPKGRKKMPDDQDVVAWLQVSAMRQGAPPIITSSQNALRFAGIFLKACQQSLQSVQQGGDPAEVVHFISLCGPAGIAHLRRIQNDPNRKQVVEAMFSMFERVMEVAKKLEKGVQQQQEKQQQLQKKQAAMISDGAIKFMSAQGKLALQKQKQDATLAMKSQSHNHSLSINERRARSEMSIADAKSASDIHRQNRLAAFKE